MRIERGSIIIYRLFDVAWGIDLARVERRAESAKRLRLERRRFTKSFHFANPPLTISLGPLELQLRGRSFSASRHARLYDYGVLTVMIEIETPGVDFAEYEAIARAAHEGPLLEADIHDIRKGVLETFADALTGKGVEGVEEDYTVFCIHAHNSGPVAREAIDETGIATLLLMEDEGAKPSAGTIRELLANAYSYLEDDLVVVNWDNALVIEPSGSMDIPDLLEFANSHLLELRVYDQRLSREMDAIYGYMNVSDKLSVWKMRRYSEMAAKLMVTVSEFTEIMEKIDNSLKVTDDVHYARVYSATLGLFRLGSWTAGIKHKIDVASRAYEMLGRAIGTKRSEWLELIIILLIALEIVFFVITYMVGA